uniref:Pentacotripeptide-repeat region of PRORP domain-containing protein n=1 Tax=Oryza meridionalis TaxID=40149 RepID=A0A0E0DFG8_9ORYZ
MSFKHGSGSEISPPHQCQPPSSVSGPSSRRRHRSPRARSSPPTPSCSRPASPRTPPSSRTSPGTSPPRPRAPPPPPPPPPPSARCSSSARAAHTAHPFNALICSLTHAGDPSAAFRAFALLLVASGAGARPDGYTLPAALKACARLGGGLREGRQAHAVAEKAGFLGRVPVQNALVTFYGACGQYGDARKVFDEMAERDVVSWTALLSAFTRGSMFMEALGVLAEMDVTPNEGTLASALVACGRMGTARAGKAVHGWYFRREKELSLIVGNALLDMYVKCEKLDLARRVFDMLLARDIVSWTVMISGLVQCKRPSEALEVFNAMQISGVKPDKAVLSTVLSACASLGALESGRWVHEYIERKGIEWDVHVGTSVVDMYV